MRAGTCLDRKRTYCAPGPIAPVLRVLGLLVPSADHLGAEVWGYAGSVRLALPAVLTGTSSSRVT